MQLASHRFVRSESPEAAVRRHPRILFSVPCTIHHLMRGGVGSSRGISLDLSESGIGVLVEGRLQVGNTVEIELMLPHSPIKAVAIVRHTSQMRSGFEFFGLTAEERAHLASIVGRA